MREKRPSRQLEEFESIEELVAYFESHDLGEYPDHLPEAKFQVSVQSKKRLIAIDEELALKLGRLAQERDTSVEALVNDWLSERVIQK